MYQGYQPALQPSFALPQERVQNGHAASQAEMEAAFERALEDARAADAAERAQEQDGENGPPEEEYREAKGDFEKVWESLRPEAERLNQLAEWERDFSQVSYSCLTREEVGPGLIRSLQMTKTTSLMFSMRV